MSRAPGAAHHGISKRGHIRACDHVEATRMAIWRGGNGDGRWRGPGTGRLVHRSMRDDGGYLRRVHGLCEEVGIAAPSGKDASLRWATPTSAVGGRQRFVPRVVGDELLVVGIDDRSSDDIVSVRTVALHASDGGQRWEHRGLLAAFIAGGTGHRVDSG
jgi:hypothetical protein